jgi:hypothetical protein
VFLPYTDTTYSRTQQWLHERGLFEEAPVSPLPARAIV